MHAFNAFFTMNRLRLSSTLFVGAAFALCSAVTFAQPVTPAAQEALPQKPVVIKVNNMPSALMAHWLDPAHQPMPVQLKSSVRNGDFSGGIVDGLPRQPGNALGPLDLKLPAGIDLVVSVDPQNVLLVKGSAQGIEALRKLVAEIDVPINQTEVEVQLLEMAPAVLDSLGLQFRWPVNDDGDSDKTWVGLADASDLTNQLINQLLVADTDRAVANAPATLADEEVDDLPRYFKIITAPRVTVLDGLMAQLTSTETRILNFPAPQIADAPIEGENEAQRLSALAWREGYQTTQSSTGMHIKCASKDDLIAMDLRFDLGNDGSRMSAIVRDGQKLAMLLPKRDSANGAVHLALITAKQIRREPR